MAGLNWPFSDDITFREFSDVTDIWKQERVVWSSPYKRANRSLKLKCAKRTLDVPYQLKIFYTIVDNDNLSYHVSKSLAIHEKVDV